MTVELVLVANAGENTIATFQLTPFGLQRLTVTALPGRCTTFAVDGDRSLAFVACGNSIVTYSINVEGELTALSTRETPSGPNYLALTSDGTRLLGVSYSGGWGLVWPVDRAGTLGAPSAEVSYPKLHSVAVSNDGRTAYFVSLGADLIASYNLGRDGSLTPLQETQAPAGSGPRHLALDASEANLYVLTEFTADVLHYRRLPDGSLAFAGKTAAAIPGRGLGVSRLGANPREDHLIWGADLHLAPNGRSLWASERTEATIATLPVAPDGSLGQVTAYEETEAQPRGFCVTNDGRVLVCGELSTEVSLYVPDTDGLLVFQARAETGKGANWARSIVLD